MINEYIVSGAGRVGGHLILNIIDSAGHKVTHTHDPHYSTGNDATTGLLIIDRRDRFAAIMSNAIVWHTGQSTNYDSTNIEPFSVTPEQFKILYNLHNNHYKQYDYTRPYGLIEHFYYEDFVDNYNHVYNRLNLTKIKEFLPEYYPAPYNYNTLIQNKSELYDLYKQLS